MNILTYIMPEPSSREPRGCYTWLISICTRAPLVVAGDRSESEPRNVSARRLIRRGGRKRIGEPRS